MNNDIYKNLKANLIRIHQNKCYLNYGYISKIYKIEERSGGIIIPEDPSASASYEVKFSCKLCRPLVNSIIVFKVLGVNKSIIYLNNGPIYMLIFDKNINMNNFVYDEKHNVWLAYTKNGKGIPIVIGTYVNATIIDTKIEDKTSKILALGILESISSTSEINNNIENQENEDSKIINYDDYMKQNIKELNETENYVSETDADSENVYDETDEKDI
jgi:DNA-directed RNA polymerase subunit E'/Rpb7